MSLFAQFSSGNDNVVDQCDRCKKHINVLNIHNSCQYCDRCLTITKRKEPQEE